MTGKRRVAILTIVRISDMNNRSCIYQNHQIGFTCWAGMVMAAAGGYPDRFARLFIGAHPVAALDF